MCNEKVKIILCVWCDESGIIHQEFSQPNQTVTAAVYVEELGRLNSGLKKTSCFGIFFTGFIPPVLFHRVLFHRGGARPHTAKLVTEKMKKFNWELFGFKKPEKFSRTKKKFSSSEDLKKAVYEYFDFKSKSFYKQAIDLLLKRWQLVVDNDGKYIID